MQCPKSLRFLWYRFPATSLLGVTGAVLLTIVLQMDIDLFEILVGKLSHLHFEAHEIDELFIPFMLLMIGFGIDQMISFSRKRHQVSLHNERIQTLQVLMASVDDLVNNSLNNMQFFRLKAELGEALNSDELEIIDDQIRLTAQKLQGLHELDDVISQDLGHGIKTLRI